MTPFEPFVYDSQTSVRNAWYPQAKPFVADELKAVSEQSFGYSLSGRLLELHPHVSGATYLTVPWDFVEGTNLPDLKSAWVSLRTAEKDEMNWIDFDLADPTHKAVCELLATRSCIAVKELGRDLPGLAKVDDLASVHAVGGVLYRVLSDANTAQQIKDGVEGIAGPIMLVSRSSIPDRIDEPFLESVLDNLLFVVIQALDYSGYVLWWPQRG